MSALDGGEVRTVHLTIPAKAEYIGLGRLALSGLVRAHETPIQGEALADLKLALTEACTNAVRHAYEGADGSVELLYELHSDRLVVEVADDGDGFDAEASVPNLDEDELVEGGLGIAIIRAIADEFEVTGREQGGSTLRFVKRLATSS
ncbi:MAG TPA: ATP-binding protein [Gaiellaceae bacterium]|nr:ATP-binding protein [Gaiellaceae bacterium]